jgi:hypothetical protein
MHALCIPETAFDITSEIYVSLILLTLYPSPDQHIQLSLDKISSLYLMHRRQ